MRENEQKLNELTGVAHVLALLQPASVCGRKRLAALEPCPRGQEEALDREFALMSEMIAALARDEGALRAMEGELTQLPDITRLVDQAKSRPMTDIELFQVKKTAFHLCAFHRRHGELLPALGGLAVADLGPLFALLDPDQTGVPAFYISETGSPDLAEIRARKRENDKLLFTLEGEALARVKGEREEIVRREREEEERICARLSQEIRPYLPALEESLEQAARFDLILQKARLAAARGGQRPVLSGERIAFTGARHLETEAQLAAAGRRFTPIDIVLHRGAAVITGANMGGKSVALKTVAQNLALVRLGLFPFAEEAECPLFDRIFFLGGHAEEGRQGLSSFGGEIVALNEALEAAQGDFCFLAVDEFARGTNPEEGAALAAALTGRLQAMPAFSLLSTHYDGVAEHAGAHYRVVGLEHTDIKKLEESLKNTALPADQIYALLDYGVVPVEKTASVPQDAIKIAGLLGLDPDILHTAKGLLYDQ